MKLFKKQLNAVWYLFNSFTTEIIYGGAAGGGKSALGCIWLITCCQMFPGTRWAMCRKELKKLKATTLKTFFQESQKLGVSDQWEYKEQKGVIVWRNGSEIVLVDLSHKPSDPDYDDLGSLEITGAFVDEVSQVTKKAWQVLKSRIRYRLKDFDINGERTINMEISGYDKNGIANEWINSKGEKTKGLIPKQLGTCNPSKNFSYKLFYRAKKTGDLAPFRAFVSALPSDNPHLPKSYLDSLDQLDEISRRRLRDGDWEYDDDKATLIQYRSILDYWNGSHIKAQGDHYLTIDVARKGKDKTVFRVWHGFVCIARFEMLKSKVNETVEKAEQIQKKYGIRNSNTIADEDGVGGGVVDYLGCEGFINNSRPIGSENYSNLKSQCSILMAKRINDGLITERCRSEKVIEVTTEEMEQVKIKDLEKDGKLAVVPKEKVVSIIGRSPDEWDTIMMREWFDLHEEFWIG